MLLELRMPKNANMSCQVSGPPTEEGHQTKAAACNNLSIRSMSCDAVTLETFTGVVP